MLLRFTDAKGQEWEVWEVGARPAQGDRSTAAREGVGGAERWLCFASGTERRRLASYPARWHAMTPRELDALCRAATPRRHTPPSSPVVRPEDGADPT